MIQEGGSHGWEGRLWHPSAAAALGTPLAPAWIERHSTSGGGTTLPNPEVFSLSVFSVSLCRCGKVSFSLACLCFTG